MLAVLCLCASAALCQPLAPTPPMGWNSWNHFDRGIDDHTVRQVADAMVASGMQAAGYEYVVIDDTWEAPRGPNGEIRSNAKFPDMKALADYIHSKGLKLGIYSSPGPLTCEKYPGSYQHEEQDARIFAAWGIDYLKYDWCGAVAVYKPADMPRVYKKMRDALKATGRPIVLSISNDGEQEAWKWGAASGGNLWRTTPDIKDNWQRMSWIGFNQNGLERYAGPGHWNDADMLEVGNGGMSATEYRTHMSLWAILASPLMAGNDPRQMTPETREILLNREVIAVDQDKLGKQGYRIAKDGDHEIWARPLDGGAWAVGLFNRGDAPADIPVDWKALGIQGPVAVRDLWAHQDRQAAPGGFSATVEPHGVVMLRVSSAGQPLIFPEPQQITALPAPFVFDAGTTILLPDHASEQDSALARRLVAEVSDRFRVAVAIGHAARIPAGRRAVLMGDISNSLVKQYCAAHHIDVTAQKPGPEGYVLKVLPELVLVAGSDARGAFYGFQSLRQLLRLREGHVEAAGVDVRDWPHMPFRAIRLYLPGHENLAFFTRFLRDFMALYKYNKMIVEVGGSMRLDRHPEINAGWLDLVNDLHYTERYDPHGPGGVYQNSAHQDDADGEILEKDEVAGIVREAAANSIEVIPEIPSLTHSYYLLSRHRELAEVPDAEWPDTYCPLNPKSYDLLFDVMDEYIAVMRPRIVSIGHDEWFVPLDHCPRCRGKNTGELFAGDVNKIHDYLKKRGIRTAMYGDYFIESVRGKGYKTEVSAGGSPYRMAGALTPEQVRALIPKDILIFNWFWQDARAKDGRGEPDDIKVQDFGFQQAFLNFTPAIEHWERRSARPSVLGGAPAAWAATNEYTFGKDLLHDYLGCANLLWSTHWPAEEELSKIVQSRVPDIRRRLGGKALPSEDGDPVEPVRISQSFADSPPPDLAGLRSGTVRHGTEVFDLSGRAVAVATEGAEKSDLPLESPAIPIGQDVSSIIFLQATSRPAANDMSYRYIHNFPDTADLLGWYEITYEDGYVETAPIRFGVNILPWTWSNHSDVIAKGVNPTSLSYAYWAEEVPCGSSERPISFFAYEWVNPRFGKKIKQVRLRGTAGFRDTKGHVTPSNAIYLAAISVVRKRTDLEMLHALPDPPGGIHFFK